jgi:hypothetical protein
MGGRPLRGLSKMPSPALNLFFHMQTVLTSQPNTELMVVSGIRCCRRIHICRRNTRVINGDRREEPMACSNACTLVSFLRIFRIFF